MWNLFINIIICLTIIFIGHQLINYIQEKVCVKKTKDIVGSQIQKYKILLENIQKQNQEKEPIDKFKHEPILQEPINETTDLYNDVKQDLEAFIQTM